MWTDIIKRRQPSPYRYSHITNASNHAVKLFWFFKRFFRPKNERSDRMNTLYYTIEELNTTYDGASNVELSEYNITRFKNSQRDLKDSEGKRSMTDAGLEQLNMDITGILNYWQQLVKLLDYVDRPDDLGNREFKYKRNFFDVSDADYRDEINRHIGKLTKDDARYIAIRADRIWKQMESKIKRTNNVSHKNRNPSTTQSESNYPQLEGDKGKYSDVLFEEKKKRAINRFKRAVEEYHYDDARKKSRFKEIIDLIEEVFFMKSDKPYRESQTERRLHRNKIGYAVKHINSLLHTARDRHEISDWDVNRLEQYLEEMKAEI